MAQLTCEICGATNFVKENGVFVCKSCGAQYTTDEARKTLNNTVAAEAAAAQAAPAVSAAQVNNMVCQTFQRLMSEYKGLDHPGEQRQQKLVKDAKECLVALDNAAMADPDNHLQDLLIYLNCDEIVDAVCGTTYWSRDAEGSWTQNHFSVRARDLEIPGQKDSWEKKATYHRDFVETAWLDMHETEMAQRRSLVEQANQAQAEIDDLKQQKKGLGFVANIPLIGGLVNSDAKDLNERMKPYKEQLSSINSQISEIDAMKKAFVEDELRTLSASMTRLDF